MVVRNEAVNEAQCLLPVNGGGDGMKIKTSTLWLTSTDVYLGCVELCKLC